MPSDKWYFDETSQWTLDYPPLFAAFEFLLSIIASIFIPDSDLRLTRKPIRTESIIAFQRASVILSDTVYYYAVYRLCKSYRHLDAEPSSDKSKNKFVRDVTGQQTNITKLRLLKLHEAIGNADLTSCMALLLLLQPGLLLVDHIHFQYNGLLSGMLILTIVAMTERRYIAAAFWFAILLNFKHIYLYCAPAVGMYLLTSYCLSGKGRVVQFVRRFTELAVVVSAIFIITYMPFANPSTMKQIISRLFPFKRGLTHAYWAPNLWAIYNLTDKILAFIYRDSLPVKFDLDSISNIKPVTSTSGLVQEYDHQVLPSIRPMTTFTLVAIFTIPLIIKHLCNIGTASNQFFMKSVIIAAFTSFMFGWHVHEKAIITILICSIPVCLIDTKLRRTILRLNLIGTYSLFPLLFEPAEYLTKMLILIAYYNYFSLTTAQIEKRTECNTQCSKRMQTGPDNLITRTKTQLSNLIRYFYSIFDRVFPMIIVTIELYITFIHGRFGYDWNPLAKLNKFDFLPLLLTSSVSAIGITVSYVELYSDLIGLEVDASAACEGLAAESND